MENYDLITANYPQIPAQIVSCVTACDSGAIADIAAVIAQITSIQNTKLKKCQFVGKNPYFLFFS